MITSRRKRIKVGRKRIKVSEREKNNDGSNF